MIKYCGVKGPFELATCFMPSRPQHSSTAALETRQHDPEAVFRSELHEALQAKAGDGQIGNAALAPGLARSAYLYGHKHRASLSQTTVSSARLYLNFCAHYHMRPLRRILGDRG